MKAGLPGLVVAALCAAAAARADNGLGRNDEPVVIAGASLPALAGTPPGRVVAFRFEAAGWRQVPVQVDERHEADFATVYDKPAPSGQTLLAYSDPGTFTGPDPDPLLDADDEVVVLAGDAGAAAPAGSRPARVVAASGTAVVLTNPLSGATARLYLFASDGTLDPAAGAPPIDYRFRLLAGDYKTAYDKDSGPNPEDSVVSTSAYEVHFADRWTRDGTAVRADGAPGLDLLDRHRFQFSPNDCTRTEDTFDSGEGAFVANRTGPIRALRAYVGANSGVTTWRRHAFYARREVIRTVLRVHPISGMLDTFDYTAAAAGGTYRNDANPAGATIDGVPDALVPSAITWESVTGPFGTIAQVHRFETDVPAFAWTSYHQDDATPQPRPCTGDAFAWANSGPRVADRIPNTDPAAGEAARLEVVRTLVYAGPDRPAAFGAQVAAELNAPLQVDVAGMPDPSPIPADDLVVDFGAGLGLWVLVDDASWEPIHGLSSHALAVGDFDGSGIADLAVDFGAPFGTWVRDDAGSWTPVFGGATAGLHAADLDGSGTSDLVVAIPGFGLWARMNGASWTQLTGALLPTAVAAGDLDADGAQELAASFPGAGLWIFRHGEGWTPVHALAPVALAAGNFDGRPGDDLAVEFGGGTGLWIRGADGGWSFLAALGAQSLAAGDLDGDGADLVADFGASGLWVRTFAGSWERLHGADVGRFAAGDFDADARDDLAVDFGPADGLWIRYGAGSWRPLHERDSRALAAGEL